MNPRKAEDWKEEVLGEILQSLARHAPLCSMLVFKGARVLNERLKELGRRSLDIDSNLLQSFVDANPERNVRKDRLEYELRTAISRHFENQSPVKYFLKKLRIDAQPPSDHPHGWDGYDVRVHCCPNVDGSVPCNLLYTGRQTSHLGVIDLNST